MLNTHFQSRADPPTVSSIDQTIHRFEFQPVVHRLRFFRLGLGPDLPETTIVAQEPGFRWNGFSPFFSLTIPTFSLLNQSTTLTVLLQIQ